MNRSRRLARSLGVLLCASALAYPASASAAGCVGDTAVVNAWLGIASQFGRISAAQSAAAGRADTAALAAATRKAVAFARDSKAKLSALHPGTIQGRTMQSLTLRFLSKVVEPSNACIMAYVKGGANRTAILTSCLAKVSSNMTQMTRDLARAQTQLAVARRSC